MYPQTFKNEPYPFEEFWSFIVEEGHLLEIGDSSDYVLSQALERDLEVTSLNISQEIIPLKFNDEYFDGAILCNLLGSLSKEQRLTALQEVYRVTKQFSFIHFFELEKGITAKELINLIEQAGFKIMRLNYNPFVAKPGFSIGGQREKGNNY